MSSLCTPGTVVFPARGQPGLNRGLMGRIPECGSAVPVETDQFNGSHSRGLADGVEHRW